MIRNNDYGIYIKYSISWEEWSKLIMYPSYTGCILYLSLCSRCTNYDEYTWQVYKLHCDRRTSYTMIGIHILHDGCTSDKHTSHTSYNSRRVCLVCSRFIRHTWQMCVSRMIVDANVTSDRRCICDIWQQTCLLQLTVPVDMSLHLTLDVSVTSDSRHVWHQTCLTLHSPQWCPGTAAHPVLALSGCPLTSGCTWWQTWWSVDTVPSRSVNQRNTAMKDLSTSRGGPSVTRPINDLIGSSYLSIKLDLWKILWY